MRYKKEKRKEQKKEEIEYAHNGWSEQSNRWSLPLSKLICINYAKEVRKF